MSDPNPDDGSDADPDAAGDANAGADRRERVETMHRNLAATAELPVTRESSAHLGEAAAVARDLAEREASPAVVRERAGHVVRLLDELDGTGHDEADDRVAAARAAAADLAGRPDDDGRDDEGDGG